MNKKGNTIKDFAQKKRSYLSKIGLFWIFENHIFYELQNIEDLSAINGFVDSDLSHFKIWEKVKKQHPKFYLYEYEDIPRGRVVYEVLPSQSIVYCNENILKDDALKRLILETFNLSATCTLFREDEHYKIV